MYVVARNFHAKSTSAYDIILLRGENFRTDVLTHRYTKQYLLKLQILIRTLLNVANVALKIRFHISRNPSKK